jgi:DNA-binding protein Fis
MQEQKIEGNTLATTVETTIKTYMDSMDKDSILNLYDLLMEQVEPALFKAVIERCKYNQSRAASMLGLSRGTLRTKLSKYFDDQYCGTRDN